MEQLSVIYWMELATVNRTWLEPCVPSVPLVSMVIQQTMWSACRVSARDLAQVWVLPVSLTMMVCPHVTTVLPDIPVEDVNFALMVTIDKRYRSVQACNHWNHWSIPQGQCVECDCNGNVDPSLGLACNMTTGQCLNCQNNTFGFRCQFCQPGFFGDATNGNLCQCKFVMFTDSHTLTVTNFYLLHSM